MTFLTVPRETSIFYGSFSGAILNSLSPIFVPSKSRTSDLNDFRVTSFNIKGDWLNVTRPIFPGDREFFCQQQHSRAASYIYIYIYILKPKKKTKVFFYFAFALRVSPLILITIIMAILIRRAREQFQIIKNGLKYLFFLMLSEGLRIL